MRPRVVLKFGTGVLSSDGGTALDNRRIHRIAGEVAGVMASGTSCVIVSSAAIAAGVGLLGLDARPEALDAKQACAAIGQPELMRLYAESFHQHGLRVAQLLLTHGDMDSRIRRNNARNTLEHLLARQDVIPIINENDSVATEEVRFGDNDRLSAEVADLVGARRLILLTSTDGLLDQTGERIPVVRDIHAAHAHVKPEKGLFSVGGMKTKLEAVRYALASGIEAQIVDGNVAGRIRAAVSGMDVGTRFPIAPSPPKC